MNIEDLNKKIYGGNILREGEVVDSVINSFEEQQMQSYLNLQNFNEDDNQIKF